MESDISGEGQKDSSCLYMGLALKEAEKALALGEVPVGAVIVQGGKVIGKGHNLRETLNDPTAHAEIIAIRKAAAYLGSWRILNSTMYVTLEPCPMCAGALVLARIPNLVIGLSDSRWGACGTVFNIAQDLRLNHRVNVEYGVRAEECKKLIQEFFKTLRDERDIVSE